MNTCKVWMNTVMGVKWDDDDTCTSIVARLLENATFPRAASWIVYEDALKSRYYYLPHNWIFT